MKHFYRCSDCLSVVTTTSKIHPVQFPPTYSFSYGDCGACGGRMEYLGEVCRDSLVRRELRVPCDARCTNAIGPHCECQCGGENHGSHRLVEVVVETGKAPRFRVPENARARAEEYRELLRAVRSAHDARFGRVYQLKRNGVYLSPPDWYHFCEGQRGQRVNEQISTARELRSHGARNRKLTTILDGLQGTMKRAEVCA
jgi:hypothetical protein